MIQYRTLHTDEINETLFKNFIRHQTVTQCWRKEANTWVVKDAPFIDDWSEADYKTLISCLKNTLKTDGFVYAAFCDGCLKGFVSVESDFLAETTNTSTSQASTYQKILRGQGIGKSLFAAAKTWAKQKGARKLYISSHSAVESQAFYHAMGCQEAQLYAQKHVEAEPYDCQLEYVLSTSFTKYHTV